MSQKKATTTSASKFEEEMELRRGPWTLEEDNLLVNYIASHGEGRWNLLARCSGMNLLIYLQEMSVMCIK